MPPLPVISESPQPRERFPIFCPVGRFFARDDVYVLEPLDAIRREHEIEVERAVLQLYEVLATNDLGRLDISRGSREG
jgi:hypothetical protein